VQLLRIWQLLGFTRSRSWDSRACLRIHCRRRNLTVSRASFTARRSTPVALRAITTSRQIHCEQSVIHCPPLDTCHVASNRCEQSVVHCPPHDTCRVASSHCEQSVVHSPPSSLVALASKQIDCEEIDPLRSECHSLPAPRHLSRCEQTACLRGQSERSTDCPPDDQFHPASKQTASRL